MTVPDMRACPECGQMQHWCEQPSYPLGPAGHWSHMTTDASAACGNLADRNREPGAPPDNAYTRGELS